MHFCWYWFVSYSCEPVWLLPPHPGAECVNASPFLCFSAYVLCGRLSKYPIDIPSPLCPMLSHDSFSPDGPTVTGNQTIILIMQAAEWVPVQRGICFLELDRTEVCSLSHPKQTTPGFVWKRTKATSSRRSRPADLVHTKLRWLHSHQRKPTAPRDQTCLVRTKCCWCESTLVNKLVKQ